MAKEIKKVVTETGKDLKKAGNQVAKDLGKSAKGAKQAFKKANEK